MKILKLLISILMIISLATPMSLASVMVRIKDVSHVKGIRDNQLVGYGVVVGLPGTGDNSRSTQITNQKMLQNLGTVIDQANYIQKGSTAAVIVTAIVPPFSKNGDKIDVVVSTLADAKSLEGGVLVQTQLRAPNGEVVAVAQGPISVGGVNASANGTSKRTTITTTGRVPNGGIVERDIMTQIGDDTTLTITLNKADYTLIAKIAQTISNAIAPAKAIDGSSVEIQIPSNFQNDRVAFLSIIENLEIAPANERAKVIVNERTGTVVIGNQVKLTPAAVAHGNITVSISTNNMVSQPEPFSLGSTVGFANSEVDVQKTAGSLVEIPRNSTLNDLVKALNAIGVTPVDLIAILQALKECGSLQAEIEII